MCQVQGPTPPPPKKGRYPLTPSESWSAFVHAWLGQQEAYKIKIGVPVLEEYDVSYSLRKLQDVLCSLLRDRWFTQKHDKSVSSMENFYFCNYIHLATLMCFHKYSPHCMGNVHEPGRSVRRKS
jgi:hypothetical protein